MALRDIAARSLSQSGVSGHQWVDGIGDTGHDCPIAAQLEFAGAIFRLFQNDGLAR
jgi:hypothetical protein